MLYIRNDAYSIEIVQCIPLENIQFTCNDTNKYFIDEFESFKRAYALQKILSIQDLSLRDFQEH